MFDVHPAPGIQSKKTEPITRHPPIYRIYLRSTFPGAERTTTASNAVWIASQWAAASKGALVALSLLSAIIPRGAYGLWIDSDIYHGSSCACSTFDNEQLSSQRDFICTGLEVWGLY